MLEAVARGTEIVNENNGFDTDFLRKSFGVDNPMRLLMTGPATPKPAARILLEPR